MKGHELGIFYLRLLQIHKQVHIGGAHKGEHRNWKSVSDVWGLGMITFCL